MGWGEGFLGEGAAGIRSTTPTGLLPSSLGRGKDAFIIVPRPSAAKVA
jgi:hypothetical protein